MDIKLLQDFIIIFGLASLVNFVFQKIKVPGIVGFLLTGIVVGPYGLGLIHGVHEIEIMAEIGVILLLFTIGMEFSLKSLIQIKRTVFLGGGLQVIFTVAIGALLARAFDVPWNQSVFYGFLIALSSTAVVMKVIQERVEVNSHHGRTSLGILIFQDLIIVPMILLIPILSGENVNLGADISIMLAKTAGIIVFVYLLARFGVPKLLHQVARTQNQELFLLVILLVGLSVAWLTSTLGLSLALGAFMAGLAISESEYSHQAFGRIVPFRDIFTSFFFVSIGMLLNTRFLFDNLFLVVGLSLGIILIKTIITGFVAFFLGLPFRTTVVVGLILSQLGEFSFLLSEMGSEKGLIPDEHYQLFLAVAILSMAMAPFVIMMAPAISKFVIKTLPLPESIVKGKLVPDNPKFDKISNHLVIIGMGLNGHNLARAAKIAAIPYLIVESDPDIVLSEQKKGEPILYGDSSSEHILLEAGVPDAEVVVVVISDPSCTYRTTELIRKLNPKAHIIIRTRYVTDVEDLYKVGADEVIPEEFETAIEIFSRVLNKYLVPRDEIEQRISEIRSDGYELFRIPEKMKEVKVNPISEHLAHMEIASLHVSSLSSVNGKTIKELDLIEQFQIIILAIEKKGEVSAHPRFNTKIIEGDLLIVMGEPEQIACVNKLFREMEEPACTTD